MRKITWNAVLGACAAGTLLVAWVGAGEGHGGAVPVGPDPVGPVGPVDSGGPVDSVDSGGPGGPGAAGGPTGLDEVCATGCSAASYVDGELSQAELARLLAVWESAPASPEGELALDTLLFYGPQTRALAWRSGFDGLSHSRAKLLARELERDQARVSVRLVNEAGEERLYLPPTRFPLGEKQHVMAERTSDLQPPEVSGTVKRVGLSHLWVRL